jgi:formamidase
VRISVDRSLKLADEPASGHNRWHPDVQPIAHVPSGTVVTLETRDSLDGQITPKTGACDLLEIDVGLAHPLTGPIYVKDAEPGDILEVEFIEYEADSFGFTTLIPGFGFLADEFSEPYLVKWEIIESRARSREIPGVAIPGAPFAGVVGVAPSHELMERLRQLEQEVVARGGLVADAAPESASPKGVADGLRTIPPRETGSNMDVKALTAGSSLILPIHVSGALFSIGDVHFAQGDGEVCGDAIEIAAAVTVRLNLRKNPTWRPRSPIYESIDQPIGRFIATTGMSVSSGSSSQSMDLTSASRAALTELIEYLGNTKGYSREQAYVLASVAADLRINQVVDVPSPTVSAVLPMKIFEAGDC